MKAAKSRWPVVQLVSANCPGKTPSSTRNLKTTTANVGPPPQMPRTSTKIVRCSSPPKMRKSVKSNWIVWNCMAGTKESVWAGKVWLGCSNSSDRCQPPDSVLIKCLAIIVAPDDVCRYRWFWIKPSWNNYPSLIKLELLSTQHTDVETWVFDEVTVPIFWGSYSSFISHHEPLTASWCKHVGYCTNLRTYIYCNHNHI